MHEQILILLHFHAQRIHEYQCIYGTNHNQRMTSIGERIKHARASKGLTQAVLAKRVGISQATIGHIEAGRNESSKHLVKIATVLGVRPEWLHTGKGEVESGWPLAGVTPEEWASLPEADQEEITMLVRSKVKRYAKKRVAAA